MEVLRSEINNNKMALIKTGVFFFVFFFCYIDYVIVFSYLVFFQEVKELMCLFHIIYGHNKIILRL